MSSLRSWSASDASSSVDALCLGTGRFLRSVLVPALEAGGFQTALVQTRGSSFMEYMNERDAQGNYEVDTVLASGGIETSQVSCKAAFSLGTIERKQTAHTFLRESTNTIRLVGVGVTEAGLSSAQTQAMKDLYELLEILSEKQGAMEDKLCVVDMDNFPMNGDKIRQHMVELADGNAEMLSYLREKVAFLNTMVDRITSARPDSKGMVPRCEPLPQKALVVLDPHDDLPPSLRTLESSHGVVVRKTQKQLDGDIALKLRIANGTHTALAHGMALTMLLLTDKLSSQVGKLWMEYVDCLVQEEIIKAAGPLFGDEAAVACWEDWRRRLVHPHFGLSTFFITQNGAAKGGIRLGPTLQEHLNSSNSTISVAMIFAFASLLRWLTPTSGETRAGGTIFKGFLDGTGDGSETVTYADGMQYNLSEGWYEFKCACKVLGRSVSAWLADISKPAQPVAYERIVRLYLLAPDGGNLRDAPDFLVQAISTLLARMVAGDGLEKILEEMANKEGVFVNGFATDCKVLVDGGHTKKPLHYRANPIPAHSKVLQGSVADDCVSSVLISEVASAPTIDLHTHLLPPTHGALCLWGIDELLTYVSPSARLSRVFHRPDLPLLTSQHYLVAEYFITAPASVTPDSFFALSKQDQADLIWKALFVDRSPVSEACRGVISTLNALGLGEYAQARDLPRIRQFYGEYRDRGYDGAEAFSERVYQQSGVRYAIMTNIPFAANEVKYWKPQRVDYSKRYRSALRVDPLLAGDRETVEAALKGSGYDVTLEGARQYLRDWCDTMKPEYMMASTPHDFVLSEGTLSGSTQNPGSNTEAMKVPGAFADGALANCAPIGCEGEEDIASVINEKSDFLSEVLMKVCEERDLPVALKIGAHRAVNPALKMAGDGVVAFADAGVLARLCTRFPKVRFLATFLSRNNQHEACVLASKFRNLHIYGCWWFCNNPSMIHEITQMRVEMLGTAFTAQHSDARVLDQLIYKWSHSRAVIANVLVEEYSKLCNSGWSPTRAEIRRDVRRLFGGSYEEFMAKSLI